MPLVDLVTVGEAFEDLIFVGLKRLPRLGEEVKTSAFVQTLGGGAVITAMAAARLGAKCGVISGLSPAAVQSLRTEDIDINDVRGVDEPHAISIALSTPRNRTFVTFNGINDQLERRLFGAIERVQARHVHFAFYPQRCRRWQRIVRRFRGDGVTTSWDFGWNAALARDAEFPPLVAELDFLFVNEQEVLLYARRRRLSTALAYWKTNARAAIVKLGGRGSRWVAADVDLSAPAPRVRAVDTTGAGDAFNGGFLAARLAGYGPRECLGVGNRLGAQSTRAPGGIAGLPRRRAQP